MSGNIVTVPGGLPERLRKARTERFLTQADLAERAGVAARTVHELESGRRDRVLAKTIMLLAESLELTYEDLLSDGEAAPAPEAAAAGGRSRSILIAAGCAFALTVLVLGGYWAASRYRETGIVHGVDPHRIEARDGLFGRLLWRKVFSDKIFHESAASWSDEIRLVALGGASDDGGRLLALDARTGEVLWSVEPDREALSAAFGSGLVFDGGFHCKDVRDADLDGDGESELIVHFDHVLWYPNAVCVVDRAGRRLAQYASKGSLYDILVDDVDEDGKDEVLIAGTNNSRVYNGATVALLDAEHWGGASVDPVADPETAVRDSSLYRIVLPGWPQTYMDLLDVQRLDASKLRTHRTADGAKGVVVDVGAHDIGAMVLTLDAELRPVGLSASDNFLSLLRRRGVEEDETARNVLHPDFQREWLARHVRFEEGGITAVGAESR